ncbi:MAG TPA: histidine--tRNA ligase [Lacipirellulaceae bacterium]|nr:histidine--tRNA ligase [Lacipirellulaceae bacterium]
MAAPPIQPRTLKGFRDYLPQAMIPREQIIDTARRVFRSYGFSPIDTPALEYLEILLGKGGDESDRLMYRFQDHGGRDVGLRFDLTVPLARFAAQHFNDLGTPFKRYHIGTVWRGENTHRGRYREFMQCDFDTIGPKSTAADAETVLVAHDLLHAIGFERFTIHVNNRMVLTGLLETLGLQDVATNVLRALDKLAKIGAERVAEEICQTASASNEQAKRVVEMVQLVGTNDQILSQLRPLVANSQRGLEGLDRLAELWNAVRAAGVPEHRIKLDVSIARGLDYYTGTVLETLLDDKKEIGSVCSGGRYDNLAELYTNQQLPGIGASLGLDRLLAAMEELGMLPATQTPAEVFIPYFDAARLGDYFQLAAALRTAGLRVEVYPDAVKLGKQLQYADRKGFRVAVIVGEREFNAGDCQVKNLTAGTSVTTSLANSAADLIAEIERILAGNGSR